MAGGDVSASEVYHDRRLLERLGYGILDVAFDTRPGPDGIGVGFEDVRNFSYIATPDEDPKYYRRQLYDILGRYFPNDVSREMWQRLLDYKVERMRDTGENMDIETAAKEWFARYGRDFLHDWAFNKPELPQRIRGQSEPGRSSFKYITSLVVPNFKELLQAGFSIVDVVRAIGHELRHGIGHTHGEDEEDGVGTSLRNFPRLFVLRAVRPAARERYYVDLVAHLTGNAPKTEEEATHLWREILEHKWYMSERAGHDVGVQVAALDYFTRVNLVDATAGGEKQVGVDT